MNYHGVKVQKRELFFMSFKGDAKKSTMDQVTLPPATGVDAAGGQLFHRFGEWLKREGKSWEFASEEQICRWAVEYWNTSLEPGDLARRFDRMMTRDDIRENVCQFRPLRIHR